MLSLFVIVLRDSFCIIANPIQNVNAFFRNFSIFLNVCIRKAKSI